MKETGIIMSGNHPKLILDGTKTMTRRVVTKHNSIVGVGKVDWSKFCWDGSAEHISGCFESNCDHQHLHKAPLPFKDGNARNYHEYLHVPYNWGDDMTIFRVYPKWEVGDRLWVRETIGYGGDGRLYYKTDYSGNSKPFNPVTPGWEDVDKWTPSIFMPRWASRILLEITGIRAERLQEITEEDALAEGCISAPGLTLGGNIGLGSAKYWFMKLWDSLNAKRGYSWESNPWVWVIEFKRINSG